MAIYETFQSAQFGPIKFPYSQFTIKGGIRFHQHVFPHSPGSDIEKMGRKDYVFRFRVPMHDLPGSNLERDFPQLFPNRLANILALFDRQATRDLVVPSLGTIKALATDWDGTADMGEALSGESWNFEFIEDQDKASLIGDLPGYGMAGLQQAADDLAKKALDAYKKIGLRVPGIFERINDAVGVVLGALGTADAYSRLVAAKIEGLAQLCATADNQIDELQDPLNHAMLEALKNVWANAVDLGESLPGIGPAVSIYRVPSLMSIGQVSTNLYGTSERGFEILQLNAIDDAFAIKAGTSLTYVSGLAA